MAGRRDSRSTSSRAGRSGRRGRRVLLVLVLLLAGGAAVEEYEYGYGRGFVEQVLAPAPSPADPLADPAAVPPPPGLTLPEAVPPEPVAEPVAASAVPDARKVRRALRPHLRDPDLGRHVVAVVAPLAGGRPVLTSGSGPATPASTTKIVTAAAALAVLGPAHVFRTRVLRTGRGRIALVGGGDPYLASRPVDPAEDRGSDGPAYPPRADLVTLATDTAAALAAEGVRRVRLDYDASLFPGSGLNPAWEPGYVPDGEVAPIRSLMVDGGRPPSGLGRVADPAGYAAGEFAQALGAAGIRVRGEAEERRAATGAPELAAVDGAPLEQVVERILDVSDDEGAETLARHVGLTVAGDATVTGARAGVATALADLGIPVEGDRLLDGSGLARGSRLRPETLVRILQLAASPAGSDLRSLVTGLPVAAFTGSLEYRYAAGDPAGRGRVRAKTGTLSGVSGLAGVATGVDGTAVVFALLADRIAEVDTLAARDALDAATAALGACRCGPAP